MAFATTQTINTALFRNLFFRNNDNSPISSLFILNTNGRGGTFWGPTITPANVSSLSSSIGSTFSKLYNDVSHLESSFTIFSTQTYPSGMSTVQGNYSSTFQYYYSTTSSLALSFIALSNQQIIQSNALIGALAVQTNQIYLSSLQIAQSTYDSLTNVSTYTNAISSLNASGSAAMSSISTGIMIANANTFSTLSSLTRKVFLSTLTSSYTYTDNTFSTYNSLLFTIPEFINYSTQYYLNTSTLFSSLNGLYSTSIYAQQNEYSTYFSNYNSTLSNELSSVIGINNSATLLYAFSTTLTSSIYNQTSSITAGVFAIQDSKLSAYYSSVTSQISTLSSISANNSAIVSSLSSYVTTSISSISSINSTYYTQITGLASTFSTISLSSILGSVYNTFNLFEIFCNDLVISTTNSINFIQSTNYYSTILQNISTTDNYFSTLFQDPFTQSTIQKVSTTANQFLSSYISSLYFSNPFIQSSIQSTITGKTGEYNSTSRGIYLSQLSTNIQLNQSSILNNLSTPTGSLLSSITSINTISISSFNGQYRSSIEGQNALFSTQLGLIQPVQSTLLGSQISTNSSFQTSFLLFSSLYLGLFSTARISSINQSTLIQTQFLSSLASYGSIFGTLLPSTTINNYVNQTLTATNQLYTLQTSTVIAYSTSVTALNASLSTIAFSTLYTEQQILLGNSSFFGTMNFQNFTNFYIRVRDPLISGTPSSYGLQYNYYSTMPSNKSGIITIDVSTPTSLYSNNGSKLVLPTYSAGLPNTIWTSILPSISTSDYIAMYEYSIQNNIIYTNLLNIYPRLKHLGLLLQTSTNTNVTNSFWRGSRLQVSWSNYSFLPYDAIGLPAYTGEVQIDIEVNGTVVSNVGPYDLSVSTATFALPYLSGSLVNPVPTKIKSYIVGNSDTPQEISLFTILPQFSNITITPPSGNFFAVGEVTAFSDSGANVLTSTNTSLLDGTGTTNAQFQIQAMEFNGSSSFISIPNSVDFRFGTGDFTVEWYMYSRYTGSGTYPRVFSMGYQLGASFSFSLEHFEPVGQINKPVIVMGGTQYTTFANMGAGINNKWVHMAVCRSGTTMQVFLNGTSLGSVTTSYNMNDSTNALSIGSELLFSSIPFSFFNGYITNFRWITGTALYTGTFTPPVRPLQAVTNTRLLLLASSAASLVTDSSGTGKVVSNTNVSYPTFTKANAIDGNFSTYTIGSSTIGISTLTSQYIGNTQLQATLTSVSTIRIINIDPTQNITGQSSSDASQLQDAVLQVNTWAGSSNYISTIQLTSSSVQTFRF
jgi:hypothetical protein